MYKHIGFVQAIEPKNGFKARLQSATNKRRGTLNVLMKIPEPQFEAVMATPGKPMVKG